jgi:branched-chain amino acid aminotransferase
MKARTPSRSTSLNPPLKPEIPIALNVNGVLIQDPFAAVIPAFDRSYLYGDSLYEVIRTYHGRFLYMGEHLMRMAKSAELCRLRLAQPLSHYQAECERTLAAFHSLPGMKGAEAYCRIVLSRGTGKIGFGEENIFEPSTYSIIVQPLNAPSDEQWENGARLRIVDRIRNDKRAQDPAAKTGNYLNSLLAYLEAAEEGYDDALLADSSGFLTEGSTFNLFYVRRGILATSPFSSGILDGITRKTVIRLAQKAGLEVREVLFPKERLYEADEAFLTSTTKEVFPIVSIDGKKIGKGKPGKITRQLSALFQTHSLSLLDASDAASSGTRKSK